VDVASGVDGLGPLARLTPDAPFPESENDLAPRWRLHARGIEPYERVEQQRWPGHCYRSPYPLSETYFLAAYSFERLIGEPHGNRPNMFGLYLVDAFGNKELLYRDPNVSSVWPVPLRVRPVPPQPPSLLEPDELPGEGLFALQNLYDSAPSLGGAVLRRLRILQVLPKSTPGIDRPPVGLPRGAPGKQVLGTVPVEADGSAYFRAPADVPLSFQALDEQGMAVQVMRSETYVQPGETITCVGCHEPRSGAPALRPIAALGRPPSIIKPGPEGSKPFSYPRLVQPVLDAQCVSCHGDTDPAGDVSLTSRPDGHYTASYNALAPRVSYSDQGLIDPLSTPGRFGARGSELNKLLLEGHHGVRLSDGEFERLVTWMDANALFYGTFDPDDQARQLRGEVIAGPKLE
jgi:mono/diheme cytochrome c family protein